MTKRFLFCGASALSIALFGAPTAARAGEPQTAGSASQSPAAGDVAPETVGDIVVTAQRRSERLQDVPLSVTAATGEDLNRARVNDISRMQFLTPGLTWGQQGSDSFPAIRGVRTQLVSAQSDPVIGFYVDGIYQSRTQQQSFPLFDVARVEVQRGPQGTLYGRNTFGGNISVITAAPSTDAVSGGINGGYGNYDAKQIDGHVNLPLGEWLAVRLGAYHSDHDGYVKSTTSPVRFFDENQEAYRGALRATPTPGLEINARASYWTRSDAGGGAYGYKTVGTLINSATGGRSILGSPYRVNPSVRNGTNFVAGVDAGVSVVGDAYRVQWDYQPFNRLRQYSYSGDLSYDLGGVTAKVITGYTNFRVNRSGDLDQSNVVFPAAGVASGFVGSGIQAADTHDRAFSDEVQLASNDTAAPFQWIVGGFFFHDKVNEKYSQVYTAASAVSLGSRSRTLIDTKAYAGYAQASYALVPDTFKLIGGIRYSEETKNYNIINFTAPVRTFDFATQTAARASGQAKYHKITWKAGAEYNVDRRHMLYATVSTGFESGGINNNSSNPLIPAAYAPQTVTAYEVGSKNTFYDGKVLLNASAFYNDFKNLQITILDPATNFSYYQSAGAARAYGAEFELKTALYRGFHVDGTLALLDTKFTAYTRPNPFGNTVTVNLAGNDVPMSPKIKATTSVYYEADLGFGTLTPRVDVLSSSHYFSTDYNTVLDRQRSYAQVDLSLRYANQGRVPFYLEAYANNIGDYPVIYSATLGSAARIQESFGPPRLYGVRAGVKF